MSQSEPQPRAHERRLNDADSPYRSSRDWWYDDHDDTAPTKGDGHDELSGTTRAEYVAHKILKRGAELLDPVSLNDPPEEWDFHEPEERVPVSEPQEYVPKRHDGDAAAEQDYNVHDKRWRVSEEYGYLVGGPVIADRPKQDFLEHVRGTLAAAEVWCDRSLPEEEWSAIVELAERMKQGGAHDVDTMAEVVRCIDNPGRALNK